MARLGRRSFICVLGLTLGGLLGYEHVARDEARIERMLGGLCAELNQTRDPATLAVLRASLQQSLSPEVSVDAPELGQELAGLAAVSERARDLLSGPALTFSLVDTAVHVSGALARVNANLIVTERGSGEQHRDLRAAVVSVRKSGDVWRIEAVRVDPVRPDEPEARP